MSVKGKRIVLTRPDNSDLKALLKDKGATVIDMPLIHIVLSNPDNSDVLDDIATYQWLCFTSSNGVNGFFNEFFRRYDDIRCIGACKIACVGQSTARTLKDKFHLASDVVPAEQNAISMAEAMMQHESLDNLQILIACGNLSKDELSKTLESKGRAIVDKFVVYQTEETPESDISAAMKDFVKFGADAIVFGSPSAVDAFFADIKNFAIDKSAVKPKTVAIGETTASRMRKHSMPVDIVAETSSDAGVMAALEKIL